MSKQTDGVGIIGMVGLAIVFAIASPFIWLYERVGGPWFFAIAIGVPVGVLVYKDWKKDRINKTAVVVEPVESAEERAAQKKRAAEEFHAQNKLIIQQREQQAQREYFLKMHQGKEQREAEPTPVRVHAAETDDGYLAIEW